MMRPSLPRAGLMLASAPMLALACSASARPDPDPATPAPPAPQPAPEPAPEPAQGILPIPDYTGDLWSRPLLLGDLGGARTALANRGVQFNVDYTQVFQSVVDGGLDTDTRYGGNLDYNLTLDLMRMGVLPGAVVKFRAESRYGKSVNTAAGPILPVNTDAFFPLTAPIGDSIPVTITDLNYTQFLSEQFALFTGKIDTLDGDANEFASGRGTAQFLNSNFVFNAVGALSIPYSTLGAGLLWLTTPSITISSAVVSAADSSTTSGFESLGDGWIWTTEARLQYRLGSLPGGVGVTGLYSWDNNFVDLNKRFVFTPGEGVSIATTDTTWAIMANAWQYLYAQEQGDKPVDVTNGTPDRKGVGLFARLGFADKDTNPVDWSGSLGVGGRGIIPSRDDDSFGVGYYYESVQTGRIAGILGVDDKSHGFEAFYNIAITPAAHLTLDLQWADSPRPLLDSAWILGARLRLLF